MFHNCNCIFVTVHQKSYRKTPSGKDSG
jgi:hypothetical protein